MATRENDIQTFPLSQQSSTLLIPPSRRILPALFVQAFTLFALMGHAPVFSAMQSPGAVTDHLGGGFALSRVP